MIAKLLHGLKERAFGRRLPEPRPLPPPYRSMLAINSDVEWTSWPMQLSLFDEFARRDLETASSFWMYSSPKKTWRLFEEDGTKTPEFAGAAALGRHGLLDTNHSVGGRLHQGGCKFDRDAIAHGYREMAAAGWRPRVYSNHGSKQDRQNVAGKGWADYQEGDLPGSDLYHLDLTLDHGIRFFWCDPDYTSELTALDAGLDTPTGLLVGDTGRDGNRFLRFRRWLGEGLPYGPSLCNFSHQLSQVLEANARGYSVIYQHLGVERLDTGRPAEAHLPPLRSDAAGILDELAAARRRGDILVTTTERLLMHAVVMTAKPWTMAWDGEALTVDFSNRFELGGVAFSLTPADLSGWSLPLPATTEVRATLGGRPLEFERFEAGGETYVGLPWTRLDMTAALREAREAAPVTTTEGGP